MKKKFLTILILFLTILFALNLAACSQQKKTAPKKPALPSAKTVLVNAEGTKFNNMHCQWLQTDNNDKILQKAEVKYSKKPLIVYANFTTNSDHAKMWIEGKKNYIQMQGTATKRWFKTKLSKKSAYQQLTGDLAEAAMITFTKNAKLFKVSKINNGYAVSYSGKSRKIWNDINEGSMISSIIGVDIDDAKPSQMHIVFNIDKKYNLESAKIDAAYQDEGKIRHLKMNIDQINKIGQLKVPASITQNAVDLGK